MTDMDEWERRSLAAFRAVARERLNGYTFHQDAIADPTKRGAYEAFTALGMTPAVEA